MDKRILKFIQGSKLLAWAMRDEVGVYTASAFYAFDAKNLALIIASDEESRHIRLARLEPSVAVNIAKFGKIALLKGVQAKALFQAASKEQARLYYENFPFAKMHNAGIYALNLLWVKFTDNALLLEKKLEFHRQGGDL